MEADDRRQTGIASRGFSALAPIGQLLLALLAGGAVTATAADTKTPLEKSREAYEQQLAKIDLDAKRAAEQWPEQYMQALKALEDRLQKAAKLEAIPAVREEKARFTSAKQLPADAVVETPPELHDLQSRTLSSLADIEINRNKQVLALVAKYGKGLDALKQKLTQQGQIVQAREVDQAIYALMIQPEMIAAELALVVVPESDAKTKPAPKDAVKKPAPSSPTSPPPAPPKPAATTAVPQQDGLILYCPFDKDEGGKVTDQSGCGNNGTANGATWKANGFAGGAYAFDGNNDKITIPNSASLDQNGSFTISMWINPLRLGIPNPMLYKGNAGAKGGPYKTQYQLSVNSHDELCTGSGEDPRGSSLEVTANEWQFVALVRKGNQFIFYRNGASDSVAISGSVNNTQDLVLGAGPDAGFYAGSLDEVRIYNRALSDQEIKQLFTSAGAAPKKPVRTEPAAPKIETRL